MTAHANANTPESERRKRMARDLYLAMRRGFNLGDCSGCETFYLMARLAMDEIGDELAEVERADLRSWDDARGLCGMEFGCEGACAIVPLYSRLSR